jgi:hypothetical protein
MDQERAQHLARKVSDLLTRHDIRGLRCTLFIDVPRERYEAEQRVFTIPVDHENITSQVIVVHPSQQIEYR